MIEVHKHDEVYCRIHCDMGEAMSLKDYLSCHIPNYRFHPKVKRKLWDGKVSFFDVRTRMLPIGLLPNFNHFCKTNGYKYKFMFDTSELYEKISLDTVKQFAEKVLVTAYTSEGEKIDAYDYQIEAVHKAIANKRGVVLSATGSGKSLILYLFVRMLLHFDPEIKIMLVVPTINLVSQMYADFDDYGWVNVHKKCTRLCTGFKPDYKKSILITTWQSIYKKPPKFFEPYSALLVDECHNAKSLSIKTVATNCVNADFRIGTTGTLPTEKSDIYNITGYLGQPIYNINSKELMDRGILSSIKIVNLILKYPDQIVQKNKNRAYPEEKETVQNYAPRNNILRQIIVNTRDGDNTLILVQNIDHMERIQEYLETVLDDKYMIVNIHGKTKPEERELIRKTMETQNDMILIASYGTMSTGVSVKKIHNIIFASSYKSKIKVLQSIGRGLRTHKSKAKLLLFDIVDDLTYKKRTGNIGKNHIYKQYEERLVYYKEQKFECVKKTIQL